MVEESGHYLYNLIVGKMAIKLPTKFKCNFRLQNCLISIFFALKCFWGVIGDTSSLVQIMASRQIGDKPLSKPLRIKFSEAYRQH